MPSVGVAAVIGGLDGFLDGMSKMDLSIQKLVAPTNILGSAFGVLGNIMEGVGSFVVSTLAHALGELLADAVQWVVTQIKELISATIEAGGEFQKLEIRLNNLNMQAAADSTDDYSSALKEAENLTKEQLTWLQKLAAQTPYDNEDISKTYTLARGYGFLDEQARALTITTSDFAAGMGLGSVEIVRMMKNFGQMRSLGKVLQRDLNDLSTGAFVPVNDVLARMRLETGLAGDAFTTFRSSAEGVDSFMRNFAELVEDRFSGATAKMARTFGAATDNVKDFVKSVFGLGVVKPVLDVLGGRIASFMDELTSESRWNEIVGVADKIGISISGIVNDIIGLAPDVEGMADGVVSAMEGISGWLDEHREDIVNFAKDAAKWLREDLFPAIQQVWSFLFGSEGEPGAIQKFGAWLKDDFLPFIQREVIPGLSDLFDAITGKKKTKPQDKGQKQEKGEESTALESIVAGTASLASALPVVLELLGSIGGVIATMFGGDETQTFSEFVTGTLIPAIQDLKKWIDENAVAIGMFLKFLLLLEVVGFIVGLVLSFVAALGALVVAFFAFFAILGFIAILQTAWELFGLAFLVVSTIVETTLLFLTTLVANFALGAVAHFIFLKENASALFTELLEAIKAQFLELLALGKESVDKFAKIFAGKDWGQIGRAIMTGIAGGIRKATDAVVAAAVAAATAAVEAVKEALGVSSPSKVFMELGEFTMQGMALGIERSAGLVKDRMSKAMSNMLIPALSMASAPSMSNQNNYTSNYNLTVNSSAPTEPIIQDYGMLQSLAGA